MCVLVHFILNYSIHFKPSSVFLCPDIYAFIFIYPDFLTVWNYTSHPVIWWIYSKTCVKRPLSKRPKIGFQDQLLIQVKSIAELRTLLCLFLSGCFTQGLLYYREVFPADISRRGIIYTIKAKALASLRTCTYSPESSMLKMRKTPNSHMLAHDIA